MKDIQVFLDFTNFYKSFIKNFSKIIILFCLILKTILLFGPNNNDYIGKIANRVDIVGVDSSNNKIVSRIIKNLLTIIKLTKSKSQI